MSFSGGKWLVIYCNNKGFLNKRRKTFEKIEKFKIFNFGCREWAQQKKFWEKGRSILISFCKKQKVAETQKILIFPRIE